jgi:hypothetical protein
MLTSYGSARLVLPFPVEGESDEDNGDAGGDDESKMKKIVEDMEVHVLSDHKEDFFNYSAFKFEITKASRLYAHAQEKLKTKKRSIWSFLKNTKTDKEYLIEGINTSLLNEIDRISTYYTYEEVKLLSLSYDSIARMRSLTKTDLSLVKDLYESMEITLTMMLELVIYTNHTLKDIKRAFNTYLTVMNCHQDKAFTDFVKERIAKKDSTLRILLEHAGIFKALSMAKFCNALAENTISPIIKKLSSEGINSNIANQDDEAKVLPLETEYLENLSAIELLKNSTRVLLNSVEENLECVHSTCLWHEIGIPVTEYDDEMEMAQIAYGFFTDSSMTKDDYITAKLRDQDEVDNYEEEPDKPSSDMLSLWMVIFHTTFYIINYYGLYPVAYELLYHFDGVGPVEAALCISITPIAATFLIFIYDWLFPRKGFKFIYLSSIIVLVIGNLLYAMSNMPKIDSLALCLIGRALIGAGGVRMISKKYFAIFINDKFRRKYTTIFSLMGHIGKAVGPGISALLLLFTISANSTKEPDKYWVVNQGNVFTIFCTAFWVIYLVVFLFIFRSQKKLQDRKIANLKKQERLQAKKYESLIQEMKGKDLKKIIIEGRKRSEDQIPVKDIDEQRPILKRSLSQLPPVHPIGLHPQSDTIFLQQHGGEINIDSPPGFHPSPAIKRSKLA